MVATLNKQEILHLLSVIKDPEIPVVSIAEMGMLRDVSLTNEGCEVILSPTYTGCPAMWIIEADIVGVLRERGIANVTVKMVYDPPWTTDLITDDAKQRMLEYGIAPPLHSSCRNLAAAEKHIDCPWCGSHNTAMVSRYGSTACKSLYKCGDCHEPFEYFKCHA